MSLVSRINRKLYQLTFGRLEGTPVHLAAMRLSSRSPRLASVYVLLSGGLGREHQAVLAGRYRYLVQQSGEGLESAVYTLRRNTHRIEKGLIMRPRRGVFAVDYILETVDMLGRVLSVDSAKHDQCELVKWSVDVLTEYFNATTEHPTIETARKSFDQLRSQLSDSSEANPIRRPYERDLQKEIGISIDSMTALALRRRSCRWFQQKPVPRELIDKAMSVAAFSPSACNRQPFEFRFFDAEELTQTVAAIPGGTAGFSDNFPCVAVLIGDLSAFPFDRDRHVPYVDASLAAMAFQFGLEVQGISSCCINWPDVASMENLMAKTLNLASHQRVIMMMAIGYPDPTGMVPFSQKKTLDELRSYNKTC